MYSSLFTSGLQRAEEKTEERVSFPTSSSSTAGPSSSRPASRIPAHMQRLRVPTNNPALCLSPSRRAQFATFSPRRKAKSSLSSSAASPLAGIKTPIKAAEVAARMQSMLLSPSRPQQMRSSLPALKASMSDLPDMSGAPARPRPSGRLRRLPAKKPPPNLPLPSIPSNASDPGSLAPSPTPFAAQFLPDAPTDADQSTPRGPTTSHPPQPSEPPPQPYFSPSMLPTFTLTGPGPVTPAPPSQRVGLAVNTAMDEDVFGTPPPRERQTSTTTRTYPPPARGHARRLSNLRGISSGSASGSNGSGLPPALPESPIHPAGGNSGHVWR